MFRHPCGIEYALVADPEPDAREPYDAHVPAEHAIRGAYGTATSVTEQGPMDYFIVQGMNGEPLGDEGENHQYRIGEADGFGRILELVEEPDLHQGTWHFGEGTIHHQAFDVGDADNQQVVKDHIVGLGFTDVSEAKDRGYFFSMYCRSPSGLLVELAWGPPDGFLIDETAAELGTHVCIPPHWEHRRAEIAQLEPIDAEETVVS
jgi:glyoxalase family protein